MNPCTTDNIRQLIDTRLGTSWGPGRVAAGSALVAAILDAGPELLTLAERQMTRLERDRLYSRAYRKAKREAKAAERRHADAVDRLVRGETVDLAELVG